MIGTVSGKKIEQNCLKQRNFLCSDQSTNKRQAVLRLNGTFIRAEEEFLEWTLDRLLVTELLETRGSDCELIHEFGSGTGHHLKNLAGKRLDRQYFGYDLAVSSQSLIKEVREMFASPIHGRTFNFFDPDHTINLEEHSCVFTFGALEQVGNRYK